MNCPTCHRILANNAKVCPSCQHDFVADRRQQVIAAGILAAILLTLLSLISLILLLPGIIINTIRGRYKNRSRGLLSSSLRDWQTWLISLPFAIPIVVMTVSILNVELRAAHERGAQIKAHQIASVTTTKVGQTMPVSETSNPTSNTSAEMPVASPRALPVSSLPVSEKRAIFYSVTGVARGDTLNVRTGPGTNNAISARLPNGYNGIRIVGTPTLNGTTEWVHIEFTDGNGWVTSQYLQPE